MGRGGLFKKKLLPFTTHLRKGYLKELDPDCFYHFHTTKICLQLIQDKNIYRFIPLAILIDPSLNKRK